VEVGRQLEAQVARLEVTIRRRLGVVAGRMARDHRIDLARRLAGGIGDAHALGRVRGR
jgi:hypothetical protein